MNEKVEVSVVCITYNQEKYVSKMLESLVNQKTSFRYEILIHDDASTDETPNIIRKYEKRFPNLIKAICNEQNQFALGKNPNIEQNYPRVKGKYIAYCEGDDYWSDENKLQLQYDSLEKNDDCSVCVHSVNCISENDTVLEQSFPIIEIPEGIILSNEYYKLELCKTGWLFQTSSYFIRTSVVRKFVNDYKENTYPVGDLPLILFSVAQGNCYYIKRFMSCYRMNSGGYMTKLKYNKNRITHCKEFINGHKNFDKIILSSYGWQVPYKTANGEHGVASLAPKANSFEWVSETDNDQGKAIWPPKEDEIISILTKNLNKNTKIKDITFLNNILYALDMVYIKCNNASYIIPYPENPEALNADAGKYKIETGKCYRVDKFIKIMNSMFDESSVKNSDSNTVGSIALPYRKSYTLLYVIAAGILIGIIVLIAVFRHRFFHITQ